MKDALRWICVLPAAVTVWMAVDFLGPLPLNALIFLGSLVHLSPVLDVLISPTQGGEHLLVLVSYGCAVLAAWGVAPHAKLWAAGGVGVAFLTLRVAMTLSAFRGGTFTTDSPASFVVGTLAAVGGVVLALGWANRRRRQERYLTALSSQ